MGFIVQMTEKSGTLPPAYVGSVKVSSTDEADTFTITPFTTIEAARPHAYSSAEIATHIIALMEQDQPSKNIIYAVIDLTEVSTQRSGQSN